MQPLFSQERLKSLRRQEISDAAETGMKTRFPPSRDFVPVDIKNVFIGQGAKQAFNCRANDRSNSG